MTRIPFFACALTAAAALSNVWALAPGCQGSFCLGSGFETGADRDRARASEVPSAGRELLGKTAQVSAPAAASQARFSSQDSQISRDTTAMLLEEQDEPALEAEQEATSGDWSRQTGAKRRTAGHEPRFEQVEKIRQPENSHEEKKARNAAAAKAAQEWQSLADLLALEETGQLN